jgi:TPR repeat protein
MIYFKWCYRFLMLLNICLLASCATYSDNSNGIESKQVLYKKMTQKYCFQYMYGSYNTPINYKKSYVWCGKSIIGGNTSAMVILAEIYFLGLGREKDIDKSFQWYSEAAKLGHVHAQYMLAHFYKNGYGTEKSPELSEKWQALAAENNHPELKKENIF